MWVPVCKNVGREKIEKCFGFVKMFIWVINHRETLKRHRQDIFLLLLREALRILKIMSTFLGDTKPRNSWRKFITYLGTLKNRILCNSWIHRFLATIKSMIHVIPEINSLLFFEYTKSLSCISGSKCILFLGQTKVWYYAILHAKHTFCWIIQKNDIM